MSECGVMVPIEELRELQERFNNFVAAHKWISVDERMPEENQDVLTFSIAGMCAMTYRADGFVRSITCRRCYGMGLGGITHWQPLPEPPKEQP